MTEPLLKLDCSEWEYSESDSRVQRAAHYIQDALDGVERIHPRVGASYRRAYLAFLRMNTAVKAVAVLSLVLTFFERPLWCTRWMSIPELAAHIDTPCEHPLYPSYPVHFLGLGWDLALELAVILPLAAHCCLQWYAHGARFWTSPRQLSGALLCGIYVADMVYAYLTPQTFARLAPYLRIGFIVLYSSDTRHRLSLVIRTMPEVLSIFFVIVVVVAFAAWYGVLLFPVAGQEPTAEGPMYFGSLTQGMWSLYVLMTTCNYPDVMMPAYDQNRLVVLYFGLFILTSSFFLMNMLTAAVFNEFGIQREEGLRKRRKFRLNGFRMAFGTLSATIPGGTEEGVPQAAILAVFDELNHYQDIAYIDEDAKARKFLRLDESRTGYLSWTEFKHLGRELMRDQQEHRRRGPQKPLLVRHFPWLAETCGWRRLKAVMTSGRFDHVVDAVLVVNAILLVRQSWSAIIGDPREEDAGEDSKKFGLLELSLTLFYFVEAMLKMLVHGWGAYMSSGKNEFDFVVTMLTTGVSVYVVIPNEFNSLVAVRYVSMLRLLRVIRLLWRLKPFELVGGTFIRMMPQAYAMAKVVGLALYIFSVLGCQLFGGVINTDPANEYGQRLKGSAFAEARFWANNFNDMFSGVVLLFELLVVNNWFVLAGGFSTAVGPWAYSYFILFHLVGVVICLNIVVSFIIDTYHKEYKKQLMVEATVREQPPGGGEGGSTPTALPLLQSLLAKVKCQRSELASATATAADAQVLLQVEALALFAEALSQALLREPHRSEDVALLGDVLPAAFVATHGQQGVQAGLAVTALVHQTLAKECEDRYGVNADQSSESDS